MKGPDEHVRLQFRPRPWLTLKSLSGSYELVRAGPWQTHRVDVKDAALAAQLTVPPLVTADVLNKTDDLTFRRARASGRFLHDKGMLVLHQEDYGQLGTRVVTPLRLADGGHNIVNRG